MQLRIILAAFVAIVSAPAFAEITVQHPSRTGDGPALASTVAENPVCLSGQAEQFYIVRKDDKRVIAQVVDGRVLAATRPDEDIFKGKNGAIEVATLGTPKLRAISWMDEGRPAYVSSLGYGCFVIHTSALPTVALWPADPKRLPELAAQVSMWQPGARFSYAPHGRSFDSW